MKQDRFINFLAFFIPAIIAFLSYSHGETLERIGYAIPFGLVFYMVVSLILKGAKDEFRQKAPTSEKVGSLFLMVSLPVLFFWLFSFYKGYERIARSWSSLVVAILAAAAISYAIRYIVRMFEKNA